MPPTEDTAVLPEVPVEPTDEEIVPVAPASPEDTASDSPEVTEDDTTDPFEVAYEARRELEREKDRIALAAEVRESLIRESRDRAAAESAQREAEQLRESFSDVLKEARGGLSKIVVTTDDGDELTVGVNDALFEEAVAKPLQRFNANAEATYTQRVYNELAEAAGSVLPVASHEDFNKAAAGKSLPDWIRALVETNAPHSEYAKALQREVDVKVKAAEARGYAKGQKAPAGVPKAPGDRQVRGADDLTTWSGAASALARGDITEGEFRDLVKKFRSTT